MRWRIRTEPGARRPGGAYRLFTAPGDGHQQRYTLDAIANLYTDSRVAQYDRALEYYRELLAANQVEGREREVATGYFNLGSTVERKGSLEEALIHFAECRSGRRSGKSLTQRRRDTENHSSSLCLCVSA